MIDPKNRRTDLKPQSIMVHAGTTRSQAAETAEAITMTSGFVYKTAEEAENAFVVERIKGFSGVRYDPRVVDAFLRAFARGRIVPPRREEIEEPAEELAAPLRRAL